MVKEYSRAWSSGKKGASEPTSTYLSLLLANNEASGEPAIKESRANIYRH